MVRVQVLFLCARQLASPEDSLPSMTRQAIVSVAKHALTDVPALLRRDIEMKLPLGELKYVVKDVHDLGEICKSFVVPFTQEAIPAYEATRSLFQQAYSSNDPMFGSIDADFESFIRSLKRDLIGLQGRSTGSLSFVYLFVHLSYVCQGGPLASESL